MEDEKLSEEPKRGFTGFFIPVEILDDERLRNSDKLLLAEIDSLSKNEHKACYASNTHLARHLQMTTGAVANAITRLRKLGYIEDIQFDGRKRFIRLAELRLRQRSSNDEGSIHQKMNINQNRKTIHVKAPTDFDEPELQSEWEAWQQHRRQRKSPITAVARERQLKKLREMGPKRALAALRHSIENSYAGIYEPRELKSKFASTSTDEPWKHYNKAGQRVDTSGRVMSAADIKFDDEYEAEQHKQRGKR
jgi:DNA-binding transcriptional ArsR family regulator